MESDVVESRISEHQRRELRLESSFVAPLRRQGESPDIDWKTGRLLVRRSHSLGKKTRNATKQGTRYNVPLPPEAVEVLKWHVDTQLETEAQQESELLFPSVNGEFRAGSVLNRPFEAISAETELGFTFTARGMRRTYNDLMRTAQVPDLVVRSISGHASERMQHHYSTVRGDEQRAGIAKVIQLVTAPPGVKTSEYHSASESPDTPGTPRQVVLQVVPQLSQVVPRTKKRARRRHRAGSFNHWGATWSHRRCAQKH